MMKPKRLVFPMRTPALNNVSLDQTTGASGAFLINGSLASGGVVNLGATQPAVAHRLDLESAGDIHAVDFVITGTGPNNEALSETIAGPNNNTVTTTNYFRTITGITVSGAVGTITSIGTTDELVSNGIPLDLYETDTAVAVDIGGTINYSVEKCYERLTAGDAPNWVAGGLTTQTADGAAAYTGPTGGVRLKVHSYSNGAAAAMQINQARGF